MTLLFISFERVDGGLKHVLSKTVDPVWESGLLRAIVYLLSLVLGSRYIVITVLLCLNISWKIIRVWVLLGSFPLVLNLWRACFKVAAFLATYLTRIIKAESKKKEYLLTFLVFDHSFKSVISWVSCKHNLILKFIENFCAGLFKHKLIMPKVYLDT